MLSASALAITGLGLTTAGAMPPGAVRLASANGSLAAISTGSSLDSALIAAYASARGIPSDDIAGVRPGSVHEATVSSGTQWAVAGFLPVSTDPSQVLEAFQDGASTGVFTSSSSGPWQLLRTGGEPLYCPGMLPVDVQQAMDLFNAGGCPSTTTPSASGQEPPASGSRAAPTTANPATIVQVAEDNVGIGDNPASVNFGFDCNPFTTLIGNPDGASQSGCGTDSHFGVRDTNEEWCSDFAKYVWEKGGVTADLGTLTPLSSSFFTWGQEQGESMPTDPENPVAGDAVVFYPAGVTPGAQGGDHVGIVKSVNSSGTVDLINGDFAGSSNITVQENDDVSLGPWSAAIWGTGEQWVFVSPGNAPNAPPAIGRLASVVDASLGDSVDLFGIGSNGTAFENTWKPASGWSGWQNLGGVFAGSLTAVADPTLGQSVDVFGIGTNGTAFGAAWKPATGWAPWTNMGGTFGAPLTAVADPTLGKSVDVFGAGTNGTAFEKTWSPASGWSGWQNLGGVFAGSLTAAADPTLGQSVDVFGTGTNGTAFENTWKPASGWSGWQNLGGTFGQSLAAAVDPTLGKSVDAFGVGTSGTAFGAGWKPATGWAPWTNMGGTFGAPLTAVADPTLGKSVDVFGTGTNGTAFETTWTPSAGWSAWQNLGGTFTG